MKTIMMIMGVAFLMGACQNKKSEQQTQQSVQVENVGEIVLNVDGMTCEGCEKTIEAGIKTIEGVAEVKADHISGKTIVTADTLMVNEEALARIIQKVGYHIK